MEDNMLPGCPPGELEKALQDLLDRLGDEVLSHPEKPLRQHLRGVWEACEEFSRRYQLPLAENMIRLTALLHDIYKADARFQRYIRKEGEGVPHALPSAWAAFLFGMERGVPLPEALLAGEAIRRHHTHLEEFGDIENKWRLNEEVLGDLLTLENYYSFNKSADFIAELEMGLDDFLFDSGGEEKLEFWLKLRLLYSLLVACDRMNAAGIDHRTVTSDVPAEIRQLTFEDENNLVNRWRSEVQSACFQRAQEIIKEPGIYSLSLPTGAGKTLLGFKIAHHLVHNHDYRTIIYALPFISIVEQTTQVAENLFGREVIQEDHSLRPIDSAEHERNPIRRMADLFRYWYAPLVLTTFAELWDSFFASSANRTMNFHRLSRAVVILDEPQTIPPKYWRALGELMDYLSREMHTVFLLMTATQPHIYAPQVGKRELSSQAICYPCVRHTYAYLAHKEGFGLEELLPLIDQHELLNKGSGLVLLNTRRAVLAAYDILKAHLEQENRPMKLRLLSTWLTPVHRRKVIEEIKAAEKKGQPMLLVSTQVIEAGVDLDFQWVIRDFAPLDSIIQAGGRCNRHGKRKNQGLILIVPFVHSKRLTGSYIYDRVLREATQRLLEEHPNFDETKVTELMERYFDQVTNNIVKPEPLCQDIKEGKWGTAPYLYEKKPLDEVSLIIEENEKVLEWISALEKSKPTLENFIQRKTLMQKIQQHIIQVPSKALQNIKIRSSELFMEDNEPLIIEVLGGSFYLLRRKGVGCEPSHPYHLDKGFVPPEDEELADALIF